MEPVVYNARYRLEEFLGQGGTSTVHRATDLKTGETCVVKELDIGSVKDLKEIELFERECQVLGSLDHPRIPKSHDYFSIEGDGEVRLFLVQEYVSGRDLQSLVEGGHRFTPEEILELGLQVIDVLMYLHRRRPPLIHRDIKPSNLMLRDDGQIMVIDFGAVRNTIEDAQVGGSTVVGTFGYMAPEQFRGHAAPATDVYALGASMLFLFTGRDPSDFDQTGLKLDIRTDAQLTPGVADLLEAMLEPDVKERTRLMPQLLKGFDRLRRGAASPFLPAEREAGRPVVTSGVTVGGRVELPKQVQALLTPELRQMTDDLRDLRAELDRTRRVWEEAKSKVSTLDWLNVFTDSPEEVEANARKAEHDVVQGRHDALYRAWREGLEARASLDPLFAMASRFEEVLKKLHKVKTDKGEFRSRPSCKVYKLDRVFEALGAVDARFREYTGVAQTFEELDRRIHEAAVEPDVDTARRQLEGLELLERGIVERAVGKLRASDFPRLFAQVKQLERQHAQAKHARDKADEAVHLWDRINIFSDSPEQVRLKALARQLGGVWAELEAARGQMRQIYQAVLEAEPVMGALLAIGEADHAVGLIKATPTSHTRVEHRANGETRRKTYYTCSLRGVSTAVGRAREAERAVWAVLGEPMGLEAIERCLMEQL